MSFTALPDTDVRSHGAPWFGVGSCIVCHDAPFHRAAIGYERKKLSAGVPIHDVPTAQTSEAEIAVTATRSLPRFGPGALLSVHAPPSQCSTSCVSFANAAPPAEPTAPAATQ